MAELTVDLEGGARPEQSENWYELPGDRVAASMDVDPAKGLSAAEAAARLEKYGLNKFAEAASHGGAPSCASTTTRCRSCCSWRGSAASSRSSSTARASCCSC